MCLEPLREEFLEAHVLTRVLHATSCQLHWLRMEAVSEARWKCYLVGLVDPSLMEDC